MGGKYGSHFNMWFLIWVSYFEANTTSQIRLKRLFAKMNIRIIWPNNDIHKAIAAWVEKGGKQEAKSV